MSAAPTSRSTVVIALDLIDAPQLDARIERDPEKLEELSRDILRRGLIEPIKVVTMGERYEVVDGFRRFLATKHAGLTSIECFVYPSKELALEGIKYAANIFREDMSPAEEAIMFLELYKHECGEDIERVAALCGKSINYIDNRLQLVMGDELVFAAVKDRKISLGVAAELNKIDKADYRRYYLQHAIKGGSTVSTVAGWVQEYITIYADRIEAPPPPAPAAAVGGYTPTYDPMRCAVCNKSDHRLTVQVNVHASCQEAILDPLLATYRGDA